MAKKRIVLLFPCIGKRVCLSRAFRKACSSLGYEGVIVGTDSSELSAALQCCDRKYVVKSVKDPGYARQVMDIARKEKADLLIPTTDFDLGIWAKYREPLKKTGCTVLISTPRIIQICQDKRLTYQFLAKQGFDTPKTMMPRQALKEGNYPYFLKPWDGYASRGNAFVRDREELKFYSSRIPNCLVQEYVGGQEHTVDVLVDFEGQVRCVSVRRRLETLAGEVRKSMTVKNEAIIQQAQAVAQSLGAGPGVITIQCFLTDSGAIKVIEINPRFGGGVPLSIQAGANFPKWILQLWLGQEVKIPLAGWKDRLVMLRYDEAVWMSGESNNTHD